MRGCLIRRVSQAMGVIWLWLLSAGPLAAPGDTTLISGHGPGLESLTGAFNQGVSQVVVSEDGQYVAFSSSSPSLVEDDTNSTNDILVFDRQTLMTTRVSVGAGGAQGNSTSFHPALSADGRYVAFTSWASNLVTGDTNNASDIFVHDRDTGVTTRVSVGAGGAEGGGSIFSRESRDPALSADGRYVAFTSWASNLVTGDTNNTPDIFVHDRDTGVTTRVSVGEAGAQGSGYSDRPAISADGRYIAFSSTATNLVPGDTNATTDVFIHDRQTSTTTRVNVAETGAEANASGYQPAISADGRYVAFISAANNLVLGDTNDSEDIFIRDRQTSTMARVNVSETGAQANGRSSQFGISADGRYVAFDSHATDLVGSDSSSGIDVYVHDRQTSTTTRASGSAGGLDSFLLTNGEQVGVGPISISSDGQLVVFTSNATNLLVGDFNETYDAFLYDRQAGVVTGLGFITAERSSRTASKDSYDSTLSSNGRFVAFTSQATNLVPGETNGVEHVFVFDRALGSTVRVSVSSTGEQGNSTDPFFGDPTGSSAPSISDDGLSVAFQSVSTNLVEEDTNEATDIFVHDLQTSTTTRVSVGEAGVQANSHSDSPAISADGRYIAFSSYAANLVPGDTNDTTDVFIHDRQTSTTTRVSVGEAGAQANYASNQPAISAGGRYVAFISDANNLVPGDTNDTTDVFIYDRLTSTTTRVNVGEAGAQANYYSDALAVSGDGRFVAFDSVANNLVSNDTGFVKDVFVHDRQTSTTTRVSVGEAGTQGNADSYEPEISDDGRYIAFISNATNLVVGATSSAPNVFIHDRQLSTTTLVNVGEAGVPGNQGGYGPSISSGGRYVSFDSASTNLVRVVFPP